MKNKQVVLHIIALGPPGSGKTRLIEHFRKSLLKEYILEEYRHHSTVISGQETWTLVVGEKP